MKLLFYLSGEHETLPAQEIIHLLKHHEHKTHRVKRDRQLLMVETEPLETSILRELAMSHEVMEFLDTSAPDMDGLRSLGGRIGHIKDSFKVRATRIENPSKAPSILDLERNLGTIIDGEKVDLLDPEVTFRLFVTEKGYYLGRLLFKIDRKALRSRRPHLRPHFHPSSLSPILSRAISNICGVVPGVKVFDPFCGTGGLLLEAGLLGASVFGSDLDPLMVRRCRENLSFYGIKGVIEEADALKLDHRAEFHIILTDPPYGRSSTMMGRKILELYEGSLKSMFAALKPGGMACIISPHDLDTGAIALSFGFKIQSSHNIRVHKSLTRKLLFVTK